MAPRTILAPEPLTLAELEQQLADMHAERIGLGKMLDTIPEREKEALENDASDAAFQKIDIDRRRAHHKLQRLNHRHIELDAAIAGARAIETAKQWAAYVDRYEALAQHMVEAADALVAAHGAIFNLADEAQRDGFNMYASHGAHIPYPPQVFPRAVAHGVKDLTHSLRLHRFNGRNAPIYTVRFRQWTPFGKTAYLMGQEAGFTAADCWALVVAQQADFVDQTNIPPRPLPRQKIKMPVNAIAEPRFYPGEQS